MKRDFDEKMKQFFNEYTSGKEPSDNLLKKINDNILNEKKGGFTMKINIKKSVVAIGACLAFGVTCFAAANINSWVSYSSQATEVTHLPSEAEILAVSDFVPKYAASLGEFDFESFNYSNREGRDSKDNSVIKLRDLNFSYNRSDDKKFSDKEILVVDSSKVSKELFENEGLDTKEKTDISGVSVYYKCDNYKFVTPDYKPTDEENELVDKGELFISYGAAENYNSVSQSVIWYDDESGIQYLILGIDVGLEKEEMLKMAETIINS